MSDDRAEQNTPGQDADDEVVVETDEATTTSDEAAPADATASEHEEAAPATAHATGADDEEERWAHKQVSHEDTLPIVELDHVRMVFNIANEQLTHLKEYFIKMIKRELFFREFVALEDVTLDIYPGECYGLIGVNGSGKSTLLKVIAGVLEPTSGTCKTYGTLAPLIELGAGFDMELTARENTYLNGALLGYSKEFIDENFDKIIDFAEVHDFVDMPLKNYSSGMVARIAFSIATITTPDILVVDEALSVGDFMFQQKCEDRIRELVENHGTTLLFVSHSTEQVRRVCDHAVWIDKSIQRMTGDVDEVCDAYEASALEQ